jgi:hypothetical protein
VTKLQPKKKTMTRKKTKRSLQEIKELVGEQEDILRPLISTARRIRGLSLRRSRAAAGVGADRAR